jgi:hypothetical protein
MKAIFALITFVCFTRCIGQTNIDSMLIKREMDKWASIGKGVSKPPNWMGDDFFGIGIMPDSSVYRSRNGKQVANPGVKTRKNLILPPADFKLSDFQVMTPVENTKIVSYIADGPVNVFATTVWVNKGNEWRSVFYQATPYKRVSE